MKTTNLSRTIKTVLIANRGEIATRINSTCQALGIKTIAIYTKEDQLSPYVFKANKAYKLPQGGLVGYLDQDAIITIAQKANAIAIHPGYGFLAESAQFAQQVIDAGILWIGPTPKNIEILASKARAQKVMIEAGIPTIPGYSFSTNEPESLQNAQKAASMIGFPIIIKCANGGGGKAMRSVATEQDFEPAWNRVVSESKKIFHSEVILIEKKLENPRHVEVQIAGDGQNYIHLYERECSIQRNHQKIIEFTPCSWLHATTKQELLQAAIKAAQAVAYKNIGTAEFLVTSDQNFYFLEMNTRLQVEHAITEMTINIDLVYLQLSIAAHGSLPYKQHEIRHQGHAIECRICSENPDQNFAPSTGTITNLVLPRNPFLRIDHDLQHNQKITPFFDPMLAKIITWGNTREIALAHMIQTLQQTTISGIETNIQFLLQILASNEFINDQIHTQQLPTSSLSPQKTPFSQEESCELAALILTMFTQQPNSRYLQQKAPSHNQPETQETPSHKNNPWRNQRWK